MLDPNIAAILQKLNAGPALETMDAHEQRRFFSAMRSAPAPIPGVESRDLQIDTGDAVARQLARLLESAGLQRPGGTPAHLHCYTSGSPEAIAKAFSDLLGLRPVVEPVQIGQF